MIRAIIGCERSGVAREALRAVGVDAWSCDLEPAEDNSPFHLQGDVLFHATNQYWDLGIFHPECTYLCSSGLHWNKRVPGRADKTEQALEFVRKIMALPIKYKAIENPVGCIGTRIRKADQYIQPHQFGHDASKKTGLWLENLPHLKPTLYVEPRMVGGKPRWANQTDSGQNRLGPSEERWMERSRTYDGIAAAMTQWVEHIELQEMLT